MYRDDPLDDELELRDLLGDGPVDRIAAGVAGASSAHDDPVAAAADALRVLQGWVDDDHAAAWFVRTQRRLDGLTPVDALAAGRTEDVLDAAQAWAAAQT